MKTGKIIGAVLMLASAVVSLTMLTLIAEWIGVHVATLFAITAGSVIALAPK